MAEESIEQRLLFEAQKYRFAEITEATLKELVSEIRNRTKAEIEDRFKAKWHLVKDEMPKDGQPVWFYPPLIGYRSGRWNSYKSAMSKLCGGPTSEREEDHWSPEFGNNFLGRKNDLIAWAYMDDDFIPTPKLKIELDEA